MNLLDRLFLTYCGGKNINICLLYLCSRFMIIFFSPPPDVRNISFNNHTVTPESTLAGKCSMLYLLLTAEIRLDCFMEIFHLVGVCLFLMSGVCDFAYIHCYIILFSTNYIMETKIINPLKDRFKVTQKI